MIKTTCVPIKKRGKNTHTNSETYKWILGGDGNGISHTKVLSKTGPSTEPYIQKVTLVVVVVVVVVANSNFINAYQILIKQKG